MLISWLQSRCLLFKDRAQIAVAEEKGIDHRLRRYHNCEGAINPTQ
jgi:hypothetical protein